MLKGINNARITAITDKGHLVTLTLNADGVWNAEIYATTPEGEPLTYLYRATNLNALQAFIDGVEGEQ